MYSIYYANNTITSQCAPFSTVNSQSIVVERGVCVCVLEWNNNQVRIGKTKMLSTNRAGAVNVCPSSIGDLFAFVSTPLFQSIESPVGHHSPLDSLTNARICARQLQEDKLFRSIWRYLYSRWHTSPFTANRTIPILFISSDASLFLLYASVIDVHSDVINELDIWFSRKCTPSEFDNISNLTRIASRDVRVNVEVRALEDERVTIER